MHALGKNISQKCRDYLNIPSVIGFEEPFFVHLEKEFKSAGIKTESFYNRYGRRILMAVTSCGFERGAVLSAHIDRHGLYKILDKRLAFDSPAYGKIRDTEYAAHAIKRINFDKEEFDRNHLLKVCNYFAGEHVRAYDPVSFEILVSAKIESNNLCVIDDYLTFELPELDELRTAPHQIIPVAFVAEPKIDESYIIGQIDNALSVAVISTLFELGLEFTAILTTDEEIGESWQFVERFFSKHNLESKNLLVLDTSPYANNADELQSNGSVVLRYADNYAPFNRAMTHKLKSLCEEKTIPYDFKDLTILRNGGSHLGNTELGKLILRSNNRFSGTTLQVPTTEYHTNRERASIASTENMFKLAAAFINEVGV